MFTDYDVVHPMSSSDVLKLQKIYSLLIERNLQWAYEVNVQIYLVTNGFHVREYLSVAQARICLDTQRYSS